MKVIIDDKELTNFSSYTITLKFDAIASGFSLNGKSQLIEKVLQYNDIEIFDDNNDKLLTGTVLSPNRITDASPRLRSANGYSKPGVLQDVSIAPSLYPLQFDGLSLNEIARKILGFYDIDYIIDSKVTSEASKAFEKVNDNPGTSPKQLINKLASQRNILITHDEKGRVVFTRLLANTLQPALSIDDESIGIKTMSLNIDAKTMHSDITIMREASKDNPDAGEATINNPYIDGNKRPLVKTLRSGDIFDVETAARNELSAEIAKIELTVNTTKFVKPGNLIEVQSDELGIKQKRSFFVRQTEIKGNAKGDINYTLFCVPKDVYTNDTPENIFE